MNDLVIDNVIRSQIVEDYLDFFENKDLESIDSLIADDCSLTDWGVGTIVGKSNVINAFSDIFEAPADIEIDILHLHEDPDGILTSEMKLRIGDETMSVADIIGFNEDDQIQFIRAYKG